MAALKLRQFFTLIMVIAANARPIVGNCQQPFSGLNCKRRNIAYNLQNLQNDGNVLGFSSYNIGASGTEFWPARAFDGDFNSELITKVEQNPYLWVNLKSNYTLHTMTLYTDANRPSDLNGFKIEVAYSRDFQSARLCYQDQSSQGQRVHLINCTQPIEGQYVRIQIPTTSNNSRSLRLYEFEIYQCEDGYYGPDCTSCGQCQNGAKCDNINGECPVGCRLGFVGMLCNECADGYYGYPNCKMCGQCRDGVRCDKISGECPGGCVPGKKPNLCQTECDDGTYGQGCTSQCGKCANNVPCNKIYGTCNNNCAPGYAGPLCNECPSGYYGYPNCKACGRCQGGINCNKITGECPYGCVPGRKPTLCHEDCDDGTYGQGCTGRCGKCANNVQCNKLNGACTHCAAGYSGQLCNECADGYYGFPNCAACGLCRGGDHCNKINGECPNGCGLGRTDKLCKAECRVGTYGTGCAHQCGNCANNVPCDKIDGTCPTGCKPRFTGQLCDECAEGYSGMNCELSSVECPDCSLCATVDGARSVARDDDIDNTYKSPTGYIVGLCIAIVLCIITTALMVVFYFQKQRYLKLYIASDATRYASFQKNPVVDASEVVYEQPPL